MTVYHSHQDSNGQWKHGICRAKSPDTCPYGGDEGAQHFTSQEEAVRHVEDMTEKQTKEKPFTGRVKLKELTPEEKTEHAKNIVEYYFKELEYEGDFTIQTDVEPHTVEIQVYGTHMDFTMSVPVETLIKKRNRVAFIKDMYDRREYWANRQNMEDEIYDIVADMDLGYGNTDVYFHDDGELNVTLEAPNHTTLPVYIDKEEYSKWASRQDAEKSIQKALESHAINFDPEEEFETLWSEDFGKHNRFTAEEFKRILREDSTFFLDKAGYLETEDYKDRYRFQSSYKGRYNFQDSNNEEEVKRIIDNGFADYDDYDVDYDTIAYLTIGTDSNGRRVWIVDEDTFWSTVSEYSISKDEDW